MFVKCRGGYDRHDQQFATGKFLVVFSGPDTYVDPDNGKTLDRLWCAVRKCRMGAFGNFMMGSLRLLNYRFVMSGGFGGDGLPHRWSHMVKVTEPSWAHKVGDTATADFTEAQIKDLKDRALTAIPDNLASLYWNGEGHNEVGSGATDIRAWALANLPALTTTRKAAKNGAHH